MIPAIEPVFINYRSNRCAGTFVRAAYHTSHTFHHNIRWCPECIGGH